MTAQASTSQAPTSHAPTTLALPPVDGKLTANAPLAPLVWFKSGGAAQVQACGYQSVSTCNSKG